MSAGAKRDGGFAPEQWPERIELHGKTFRAAKTTVDRQKAAADLLNAVSSMLRHEGLGSPTPEAAKAVSVIFSAFSKLSDGDQPELLKVWHVQGNPGDMPQRQRMKSLAAAWVEALVRFGEKKLSATSIVSDALTALGERGHRSSKVSAASVKEWTLDELAEKHLPDIEAFLAFRTSGWRPELDENEGVYPPCIRNGDLLHSGA